MLRDTQGWLTVGCISPGTAQCEDRSTAYLRGLGCVSPEGVLERLRGDAPSSGQERERDETARYAMRQAGRCSRQALVEVFRARVAPADRMAGPEFLGRFAGEGLEVAWEAPTGWRFVIEELRRIDAEVRLAEPAETSGLRGPKKRAKTD